MALGFRTYTDIIHDFRKDILKLGPFPKGYGVGRTATGQPVPILHAFSRHVVPRPNDWPEYARITGYWFMDSSTGNGQPPADLKTFLDAGEPPVYAGFGSMAGRDPERLTEIILDALQQSGSRGIIASGWGGLSAVDLPDSIMAVPSAPHDWLFPRTAAVIHHGGAGTTAAGLRAGCPTIICPFFGDQPFWGTRVSEMGVGPAPIPQKKLTVSALAHAITQAKSEPMQEKAKQLGQQIREENGIQQAIALVEQIAATTRPSAM
jgi:sterol 3beta-glucosyltransferase